MKNTYLLQEKKCRIRKRVLSLFLSIVLVFSMFVIREKTIKAADTSFELTAQQLVDRMGVGWNLGNSLDSAVSSGANETAWGNPRTTKALIDEVRQAGFKTIRIPVTWTYRTSGYPNYTIDSDWMDRVEEVVNYALDNDMYVILNTHHEGGNIIPNYANQDNGKIIIEKIWTQIANRFKNYGGNLIFEVLNEPRVEGGENEWGGGTDETRAVLNAYNQLGLETIRKTGGNNEKRKVMIPSYAASVTDTALYGLSIPNDSNVIVSVHAYTPWSFANAEVSYYNNSDIDGVMSSLYSKFVSKGIPVILGEFGISFNNNENQICQYASYYVQEARKKGITCVWWDNNANGVGGDQFGLINRSSITWTHRAIADAMITSEASVAGDYDDSLSDGTLSSTWKLYDNNGTASKESIDVVKINSVGTENWQPHYYQEGIKIAKDTPMVFSTTLKSSIDRKVIIQFELPDEVAADGSYPTIVSQTVSLQANVAQNIEIKIPAQSEDKNNVKVTICMGAIDGVTSLASHTIEVANASLSKVIEIPGTVPVNSCSDKSSTISFTTENGITYAGNLSDASYLDYEVNVTEEGRYKVGLKLAAGATEYNAKNILVKVNDTIVATVPIQASSSWTIFIDHTAEIEFNSSGKYKFSLVSDGGACNITDITFVKVAEEETTLPPQIEETTTQQTEETTTTQSEVSAQLEINGYQISTTVEGYRVVYSVSDPDSQVKSVGMIYGLADKSTASDMIIDSNNSAVYSYPATEVGKCTYCYSSMSNAESYTMTMKFHKTAEFFNTRISVRSYAELEDGRYIYSDIKTLRVYDIADYLYQNHKMNNFSGHEYLLNNILRIVNPSYAEEDYDWNSSLVKP